MTKEETPKSRIGQWWQKHVIGDGQVRDFQTGADSKKKPDIFDLEIPDVPQPPPQGQSLPEFGLGFIEDAALGILLGVVVDTLNKIRTSGDDDLPPTK